MKGGFGRAHFAGDGLCSVLVDVMCSVECCVIVESARMKVATMIERMKGVPKLDMSPAITGGWWVSNYNVLKYKRG